MHDLGDTVDLVARCRDAAGQPADADTVVLTVTLPDGTTESPAVTNPPAEVGTYIHAWPTTQPGRHLYRFEFSGAVPGQAWTDVFNVLPQSPVWIVGTAEAKDHLNIPAADTSADEELRGFIASVTEVVEDIVGAVVRRTVVETVDGGRSHVRVFTTPLLSVTQILADGVVVDPGEYVARSSGLITRRTGVWPAGLRNIEVTYDAGRDVTPANVLDGTKDLLRVNWRPQAGGNYSAFDGGTGDDFGVERVPGEMRLGFFVPNTVMQRLNPHKRGPVVL